MNERTHAQNNNPNFDTRRAPGEPYIAPSGETPDWRRLEVAANRFSHLISDGINHAVERQGVIDHSTARCIAHTLGRAFGRESALAVFGRTGEINYEAMRDEYLSLYSDPAAPTPVIEQIDWLGTSIIRTLHPLSHTRSYREPYPLTLDELLVPTHAQVEDFTMTVHVPGDCDSASIAELQTTLEELNLDANDGLQAYLSLPNVNAMSGDIPEGFQNAFIAEFPDIEAALRSVCDLDEREREVRDFASERSLFFEYLGPDWNALSDETRDLVDIVDRGSRTYVFYK